MEIVKYDIGLIYAHTAHCVYSSSLFEMSRQNWCEFSWIAMMNATDSLAAFTSSATQSWKKTIPCLFVRISIVRLFGEISLFRERNRANILDCGLDCAMQLFGIFIVAPERFRHNYFIVSYCRKWIKLESIFYANNTPPTWTTNNE